MFSNKADNGKKRTYWAVACYAIILLIVLTSLFTSDTFAKYSSSSQSTGNTVSVAYPVVASGSPTSYVDCNNTLDNVSDRIGFYYLYASNSQKVGTQTQITETSMYYYITIKIPTASGVTPGLVHFVSTSAAYSPTYDYSSLNSASTISLKTTVDTTSEPGYSIYTYRDSNPLAASNVNLRFQNIGGVKIYTHYLAIEFTASSAVAADKGEVKVYDLQVSVTAVQID